MDPRTVEAARHVGTLLATKEGRRILKGQTSIVPAHWDEPVGDVFERMTRYEPPALIVMVHKGELRGITIAPSRRRRKPRHDGVSLDSTMGMLYQALDPQAVDTVKVDEWSVYRVRNSGLAAA